MAASATTTSGTRPAPLRRGLHVVASLVLLGTLGFWAAKGAHRGWTQNQVPVKEKDEITGLEYVKYEKRFVPGIEFPLAAAGLATGLFVVSLFVSRKSNPTT